MRSVHHDDGRDNIVLIVSPHLAKPRRITDRDLGDVFDEYRDAVALPERNILDVFDVIALCEVVGAAGVHQADATNVDGLLAHIDRPAADIDVGVAERSDNLRQRNVVSVEFVQIDVDIVFLGRAAPSIYLNDPWDGQKAALHDPILDSAQIGQPEMRRPDHLITVNFADQAGGLDLRRHAVRQTDILLQIDRCLCQSKIIIDAVIKGHPHKRQTVERG